MLYLRKIDSKGMFVEDVLLDDDQLVYITPDLIAQPVPEGFYWPRWNGDAWVEGGVAPVPDRKAEILAQLSAIDVKRVRPLAEGDTEFLQELNRKAFSLRNELKTL